MIIIIYIYNIKNIPTSIHFVSNNLIINILLKVPSVPAFYARLPFFLENGNHLKVA